MLTEEVVHLKIGAGHLVKKKKKLYTVWNNKQIIVKPIHSSLLKVINCHVNCDGTRWWERGYKFNWFRVSNGYFKKIYFWTVKRKLNRHGRHLTCYRDIIHNRAFLMSVIKDMIFYNQHKVNINNSKKKKKNTLFFSLQI